MIQPYLSAVNDKVRESRGGSQGEARQCPGRMIQETPISGASPVLTGPESERLLKFHTQTLHFPHPSPALMDLFTEHLTPCVCRNPAAAVPRSGAALAGSISSSVSFVTSLWVCPCAEHCRRGWCCSCRATRGCFPVAHLETTQCQTWMVGAWAAVCGGGAVGIINPNITTQTRAGCHPGSYPKMD